LEKICDEEGEADAKQMKEDGTVETKDHPRLRDGKQYKLHREWSRSSIIAEINGMLEKAFASTPEAMALIRQILQVAYDSSDLREKGFLSKPPLMVPPKIFSQQCADQAEDVFSALMGVLPEIKDWLDVSQASKFTKHLRRQLLIVKTQIRNRQKVLAYICSEKQHKGVDPNLG
jgi:hypothetical protein